MPRVVHFEIPAQNPEKAAAFYREVFGWQITKWEGPVEYWLVMTGEAGTPGIDGGLYRPGGSPITGIVNTVDVPNLEQAIAKIKKAGGQIVMDRMAVPGTGYMAYCKDVEGALFGIMQMDPAAA